MQSRSVMGALAWACVASLAVAACGWDPSKPFERDAPPVKQAIVALDAGDATAAAGTLEEYLTTGACAEGNIGTPESLRKKPNGTFDLGLALFRVGESFGRRFGEEESDAGEDDPARTRRRAEIDCALRVVRAIALDEAVPLELRARARYLEGNLLFLDARYEEAVKAYDQALTLAPGMHDAGDPVGRDAAWNRAIALRRIEDNKKKDAGSDAPPDAPPDAPQDAPQDAPKESGPDGGDDAGKDAGQDSGGQGDAGADATPDAGQDAATPPPPQDQDAAPPPPPRANQDERILDQLENAPTLEQERLKRQGQRHRVRGMADK